jgi:hypothetical protein
MNKSRRYSDERVYIKKGIYAIRNKINQKIYIGSTGVTFIKRWHIHSNQLRTNTHANYKLQRAWNKYGEDAFEFIIVEVIECDEEILAVEQYYIDVFYGPNCYNLAKSVTNAGADYWKAAIAAMTPAQRFMFSQKKSKDFQHNNLDVELVDLILLIHEHLPNASNGWIAKTIGVDSTTVSQVIKRYKYLLQIPQSLTDERLTHLQQKQAYKASVTELNVVGRPNKLNEFKPMIKHYYDLGYSLRAIAKELPELGYVTIRNALNAMGLDPSRKATVKAKKNNLQPVHK